jgi:uncharacterized membrane protein
MTSSITQQDDVWLTVSPSQARLVYVALLLLAVGWILLICAPAWLLAQERPLMALSLYRGLAVICHQIPERSLHWLGAPLGVCVRCMGIYVGFVGGLMLYPLVRSLRQTECPARRWLLWAGVPMLIDCVAGWLGIFTNTFTSRAATGFLFGATAAFYVLPSLLAACNPRVLARGN